MTHAEEIETLKARVSALETHAQELAKYTGDRFVMIAKAIAMMEAARDPETGARLAEIIKAAL